MWVAWASTELCDNLNHILSLVLCIMALSVYYGSEQGDYT